MFWNVNHLLNVKQEQQDEILKNHLNNSLPRRLQLLQR